MVFLFAPIVFLFVPIVFLLAPIVFGLYSFPLIISLVVLVMIIFCIGIVVAFIMYLMIFFFFLFAFEFRNVTFHLPTIFCRFRVSLYPVHKLGAILILQFEAEFQSFSLDTIGLTQRSKSNLSFLKSDIGPPSPFHMHAHVAILFKMLNEQSFGDVLGYVSQLESVAPRTINTRLFADARIVIWMWSFAFALLAEIMAELTPFAPGTFARASKLEAYSFLRAC
mmetsp:Transcript_12269/g.30216  ORF Transcript_12269/g.30216 Transcript_12269/m.30216 type:complete len:223 (-) Transcript_12269:860-1528(-)